MISDALVPCGGRCTPRAANALSAFRTLCWVFIRKEAAAEENFPVYAVGVLVCGWKFSAFSARMRKIPCARNTPTHRVPYTMRFIRFHLSVLDGLCIMKEYD